MYKLDTQRNTRSKILKGYDLTSGIAQITNVIFVINLKKCLVKNAETTTFFHELFDNVQLISNGCIKNSHCVFDHPFQIPRKLQSPLDFIISHTFSCMLTQFSRCTGYQASAPDLYRLITLLLRQSQDSYPQSIYH